MKKHLSFFLLVAMLSISNVWAQQPQLSRSTSATVSFPYSYAPQDDTEATLTWLTSEDRIDALGFEDSGTISGFMEISYPVDMINFNNIGKQPVSIKKIQFCIESISCLSSVYVVIRQGTSLSNSTQKVRRAVSSFVNGWNSVDLATPYQIDRSMNLYIGYEVTQKTGGDVMSLVKGTNRKQSWALYGGNVDNFASQGVELMIKAIASVDNPPAEAIYFQSITTPLTPVVGTDIPVAGIIQNIGSAPLTSFTLNYSADGNEAVPYHVTDIDVAANGGTYSFSHPQLISVTDYKRFPLSVELSAPNENAEGIIVSAEKYTPSLAAELISVSQAAPRVVLHESFTSSTCGPCYAGNINLERVLSAVDESKWANIRYQMSWPSTGDPYYTQEGGVKRTLYGVESVPALEIDGNQFNDSPYGHTVELFNRLASRPALIAFTSSAAIKDKTVTFSLTFTPVTKKEVANFPVAGNLRLFAAIVEKTTTKNKKGNRETLFHYVMKKFLTSANGDRIADLELNVAQKFDLSWTFIGNYRLPANANAANIISHTKEHSVENFDNLMVVYWLQNMQTREVLQAGKTDVSTGMGLPEITASRNVSVSIRDNMLYIHSSTLVQGVDIYTVSGQKILSQQNAGSPVPVNTLNAGVYIVKVKTAEGEKAVKIVK